MESTPDDISAAVGHHFAGPGNRFWRALYAAGLTPRVFGPQEDAELLKLGIGITNLVGRTTARAALLTPQELTAGARSLRRKVRRLRPKIRAIVGLGAYRVAFANANVRCGLQTETLSETRVWLLPNPSGLNAHHQPAELAKLFGELRDFVSRP